MTLSLAHKNFLDTFLDAHVSWLIALFGWAVAFCCCCFCFTATVNSYGNVDTVGAVATWVVCRLGLRFRKTSYTAVFVFRATQEVCNLMRMWRLHGWHHATSYMSGVGPVTVRGFASSFVARRGRASSCVEKHSLGVFFFKRNLLWRVVAW